MTAPLKFELTATDPQTHARGGRVETRHGTFDTPAFMPVGTQGTVKGILPDRLAATGSQIILANTYHLMLRPGEQTVAELGDLHRFMAWPGPILTDSGGFQVFSLGDLRKITEEGVAFKSHHDGANHFLSPEKSMEVQSQLGSDVVMAFDECVKLPAETKEIAESCARTTRWLDRCIASYRGPGSVFGI